MHPVLLPMRRGGYHKLSARRRNPGGVNIMLLDTSIHFVSNQIDWGLWKAASTFGGEELASEPL